MKRITVAILCIVSLVVGGGIGAYLGSDYASSIFARMVNSSSGASSAAGVSAHVRALESIRSSKADDAIAVLESELDNDLVTLGSMPSQYLPDSAAEASRRAAAYRAKFPRKSSVPELEAAIQRGLAIAK